MPRKPANGFRTDLVHIKVGDVSWCRLKSKPMQIYAAAKQEGITIVCSHSSDYRHDMEKTVEFLKRHGFPGARLVGHECDQRKLD